MLLFLNHFDYSHGPRVFWKATLWNLPTEKPSFSVLLFGIFYSLGFFFFWFDHLFYILLCLFVSLSTSCSPVFPVFLNSFLCLSFPRQSDLPPATPVSHQPCSHYLVPSVLLCPHGFLVCLWFNFKKCFHLGLSVACLCAAWTLSLVLTCFVCIWVQF